MKLEKIANFFKNIARGMSYISLYQPPRGLGDIFPYYSGGSAQQKDTQALAEDWKTIGQDVHYAINRFDKQDTR